MNIYPSILETNKDSFIKHYASYLPVFSHMQLDFADGDFVDTTTLSMADVLEILTAHPPLPTTTFEFHLMVSKPETYIQEFLDAKMDIKVTDVLIHVQGRTLDWAATTIQNTDLPFSLGYVLNPEDTVDEYWPLIQKAPSIQIMTVQPGVQGRPFIPEVLEKIDRLRLKGYEGKIILDGAINAQTLPAIMSRPYKPDEVCPGSYFHENPKEKLAALQKIILEDSKSY